MSELISGKEALIALANGEEVEYWCETDPSIQKRWTLIKNMNDYKLSYFLEDKPRFEFRLKPRTIKINNIEVPAPFEPKEGEACCFISDESVDGYHTISYNSKRYSGVIFGLYRPSDIERVVAALRSIFSNK